MRTVALLEVEANDPLKRLSGLVDVAREAGIALLPWTQPYTEAGFSDFLAAANALWMPTWTLLTVRREVEPAAFKDAELLNGVESFTLAYPYHVRISGDATAVVALPNREGLLLDTSTDFFKSSNPSSVNCVVRATAPDGRAELIVAATSLFNDVKLPSAGDARLIDLNERLAQSVFRWLVDGKQG